MCDDPSAMVKGQGGRRSICSAAPPAGVVTGWFGRTGGRARTLWMGSREKKKQEKRPGGAGELFPPPPP